MKNRAIVVSQSPHGTRVKCPKCKGAIDLYHDEDESGINDSFGRLDLGQQNYHAVVCMNPGANGVYCNFARDLHVGSMQWA